MNTNIDMDIQEPTSDNPSPSKGLLKATMPDIDNTLREIIVPNMGIAMAWDKTGESTHEALAAIHSAFKDAGYIQPKMDGYTVMTGQAWLEKFINELPQGYLVDPPILAAARRASGDTSDE